MHFSRALLVTIAAAAFVAAAAGCGSNSSTSTQASTSAAKPAQEPSGATTTTPAEKEGGSGEKRGGGSEKPAEAPASEKQEVATATSEEHESADQSIQEYGSQAGESEEAEVVEAMRGFVKDFAARNYAGICEDISSDVRAQFAQFMKAQHSGGELSCAQFLGKLVRSPERAKAARILNGVVTNVRIGEGNAFLLVKPKGEKVTYFVFTREGNAWKPTSIALGTPLLP